MVSSCCVKGCTEKFVKGGGVSYFRISSKPEMQRNAWVVALKRTGWIPKPHHRICSRHFVTGTWNADPNHIDYIPTRGMSNELGYLFESTANHNNSISTSTMDSSIYDIPTIKTFAGLNADSSFHQQCTSADRGFRNHQSQSISSRVPTTGVSYTQLDRSPVSSSRRRPRKPSRKTLNKSWSSAPKLTSSHFCEHQDVHRNCCRVIRELAEENQILKSQVSCLLYQMERLQEPAGSVVSFEPSEDIRHLIAKREPVDLLVESSMNGDTEILDSDNSPNMEALSESPPSLAIDEDLGLIADELHKEDDGGFALVGAPYTLTGS